jgi:hypothetical protein
MTELPYLALYTVSGSLGMIAVVLAGLHKALLRAGWPASERRTP